MPPRLDIAAPESRQQLLVEGYLPNGTIVDLTDAAVFTSSDPKVVRIESGGVVVPLSSGHAWIIAEARRVATEIPVSVTGMNRPARWTFENHVESVLSKQGCNSGACHGAGGGKGGFRLTLRAYDPDLDYLRICREGLGRRLVKTNPAQSLLLRKPSLALAHMGGLRLRRDSLEYHVVAGWIASGAPPPNPRNPRLVGLDVYPRERILSPGAGQRLLITARFSDGQSEDVTHWARYASNDEPIAKVDESGHVRMMGVGETAISVWYLGKVTFARVTVPFPNRVGAPRAVRGNYVDDLVLAKLQRLNLTPSRRCSVSEFMRRVYLDLTGTLPTAAEAKGFIADRNPGKRIMLINSLLERPEYMDYWTYKWADLLRVNRDLLGNKGMWAFYAWLRECVARNEPWDRVVREILTSSGEDGPANFYRMGAKPEEFGETVSQVFLGIRVQCAKCHNHPFEKWTQSDYYRMANFFARVGQKDSLVFVKSTGDVNHPKLGKPLAPTPFDGPSLALGSTGDRREFLAGWMTSPENPYFARAIVNRVWKHFMGRGLVEAVDDMRLTNPATNEPLLQALTKDFVRHGFDIKRLMRTILNSNTYQASSTTIPGNRGDDRFYSHYFVRRLGAEVLLDAICQVTGQPEKFAGVPPGARAISLPDTRVASAFLDIFGRPARQVTCECERNMEPNVAQALHLISAATLNGKVTAKNGVVDRLLDSKRTDREITDELYWSCFSRPPTPAESAVVARSLVVAQHAAISSGKKDPRAVRAQVFGDLLWAMISGPEFVFNH